MKVLYVTGACLDKNTSANMSHNGYIKGLLDNGVNVDVIMANESYGKHDNKLKRFDDIKYYTYNSISFPDKLLSFYRKKHIKKLDIKRNCNQIAESSNKKANNQCVRNIIKKVFYTIFKPDPIYPLDSLWLKNALKFKSNIHYDLVISNSSPAASHKLITNLKNNGNIKYKKWVQIWEDPWFYDIYGGHSDVIKKEEALLLKEAENIFYVSPLTLHYQQNYFKEYSKKMNFIPLPYLEFSSEIKSTIGSSNKEKISFGYFGDYFSHTRNLMPFYNAIKKTNNKCYIIGDSDLILPEQENIHIEGRITLDLLDEFQKNTSVLVHICNISGGQIPGKIYHYSATTKPILFILDGDEFEIKFIQDYFSKFNRYYFCKNNAIDIKKAIQDINENYKTYSYIPVKAFNPKQVIESLLAKII